VQWAQWLVNNALEAPPPFASPSPDTPALLDALEARLGLLPLSLRAWYELVGGVNLVGMYPVDDGESAEGFMNVMQHRARQRVAAPGGDTTPAPWSRKHDLDPLWVYPLATAARSVARPWFNDGAHHLELAPDEHFKYLIAGGGSYTVKLPYTAADAPLEYEWHETTFVDYLRTCFRWGGFPGLACASRPPEKELAFLTRGLLPI